MNPGHRDVWPPPPGGAQQREREEQQAHADAHAHAQAQAQALRMSTGYPYGSSLINQPSAHSNGSGGVPGPSPYSTFQQAPPIPGLSQASRHPSQHQHQHPHPQHRAQMPAMSQQQNGGPDARELHIKEEQDAVRRDQHRERERERERELQRQNMDQAPPHQPQGPPLHLHQPVAVGPRTVHGPNGLLGNPHSQIGPPAGPAGVFSGGAVQPPAAQPSQLVPPNPIMSFPSTVQAASVGQGQQPILNDALSYLDQVKVQFVDHPDVYNKFLDIMKDFKSGAIDTPGVIDRVSSLFAGNPELIQGFNTFLPPGYRIECGTDQDPNAIRVTTPMGTTVQAMPIPQRSFSNPRNSAPDNDGPSGFASRFTQQTPQPGGHQNQGQAPQIMLSPSGRPVPHPGSFSAQLGQQHQAMAAMEAQQRENQALLHQDDRRGVSQLQNAASAAAAEGPIRQALMSPSGGSAGSMPGQDVNAVGPDGQPLAPGMEKRGPVEFNHAISYVNKIKNRFSSQPDIYKQFLEILQTYQRESKPIQDVYGQVTRLFHSAPDLLEDFKQFLPESAAHAKAAAAAARQEAEDRVMLSNVRGEPAPFYTPGAPQPHQTPRADHRLPPVGNFAPTPTVNKENKRKRGDRQGTVMSGGLMTEPSSAAGKGANMGAGVGAGPGAGLVASGYGQPGPASKRAKQNNGVKQAVTADMPDVEPTLNPAPPMPLPPTTSSSATGEELAFFDRAKKVIGNKNTMNEFLKLCNLFSQDLIDRTMLVTKARSFIGSNPDLYAWFQNWVGFDDKDVVITNKPRPPTSRISLSHCRGLGPSYRLLPQRERLKPCGGRDELCNEVLNDEWASHPTWASEDSGFIAHRKNIHEEGLHKIEEERHDYDFNIESCARTIQLLEPIAQQLLRMPAREQEAFEVPPGLGGQSETIHKRILMKLYGRDRGAQVVHQLHAKPYAVIPVILNRLKQKLEEWKQAQREWEKVWRDQTQKMFWKSLDHQAVNAKQADKRQFQTKTLVGEIQTKYEEQKRQRLAGSVSEKILGPQLQYTFEDTSVVLDASHLLLMYAEHHHGTDTPKLMSFVREFIPMFFGFDQDYFNQQIKNRLGDSPQTEYADDTTSAFDDPVSSKPRKTNGKNTNLLRGVLDKGRKGKHGEGSATPVSRASTPDNASQGDEEMTDGINGIEDIKSDAALDTWIQHPMHGNIFKDKDVILTQAYARSTFNLYGNATIYCFWRIFTFLYERLCNLKKSEASVHDTVKRAEMHKAASELGIIDKVPSDFFGDISEAANFYRQMLGMFEDCIRQEMDVGHIEEALRRYYLQTGWQLYSFDKLLSSLSRFAISMISSEGKDKSWEILQLFKKDRAKEETTFQDEMTYRKQVEKYTKDSDIFKIEWDQDKTVLSIKIFKKEEPTFETFKLMEEDRWRVYVTDYCKIAPTDPDHIPVKRPFPVRSVRKLMTDPTIADGLEERTDEWNKRFQSSISKETLEIRVSVRDFKLYFEKNTDEYMYQRKAEREGTREEFEEALEAVQHRAEVAKDLFVINNEAMKGLSKDVVEGRNDAVQRMFADGGVYAVDADGDEEMED